MENVKGAGITCTGITNAYDFDRVPLPQLSASDGV